MFFLPTLSYIVLLVFGFEFLALLLLQFLRQFLRRFLKYRRIVHTVLLYKGPEQAGRHIISVIDPSNFKFSGHLKSLTSQEVPKLHRISPDKLERIDALYKEIKIYTPKNSESLGTGASPGQLHEI